MTAHYRRKMIIASQKHRAASNSLLRLVPSSYAPCETPAIILSRSRDDVLDCVHCDDQLEHDVELRTDQPAGHSPAGRHLVLSMSLQLDARNCTDRLQARLCRGKTCTDVDVICVIISCQSDITATRLSPCNSSWWSMR